MPLRKLYIMYLRKSRADADYSDTETLARHRARLEDFCKAQGIKCSEIIEEVGSADSIASRPGMMRLLSLVESGAYEAVVCIDMDRLSRGNGADQALLINTLKYSGTKVITPLKTYDFTNDSDETFAEFSLFFAKNEYRTIKRRMLQGRSDAAHEGKWISGKNCPYGYEPYKLDGQKGYSLRIIPERAEVVRDIFRSYIEDNKGTKAIATALNQRGIKNQFGQPWSAGHIYAMLKNPVYAGKIVFCKRKKITAVENGVAKQRDVRNASPEIIDGLHEPIIPEETFRMVEVAKQNHRIPHTKAKLHDQNPFAGLLVCTQCGKTLALRSESKKGTRSVYCRTPGCPTKQAYLYDVEERVLAALSLWLKDYSFAVKTPEKEREAAQISEAVKYMTESLTALKRRLKRIYEAFESGVYSEDEFKTRSEAIKAEITETETQVTELTAELSRLREQERAVEDMSPAVSNILETYRSQPTATAKNKLLKAVLHHVDYTKTGKELELTIYPLLKR